MLRKVTACLVLGVWLGLLAVEISEELGLFAFANEQADQAADDAVEGFGKAIPKAGLRRLIALQPWPSVLAIVQPSGGRLNSQLAFLSGQHRLAGTVPKKSIPLYQLYLGLRI